MVIVLGQAVGLFDDVTGITYLTGTFCGFSLWKCMNCGRATSRNAKGEVKNV